jgi:hypothetical protein
MEKRGKFLSFFLGEGRNRKALDRKYLPIRCGIGGAVSGYG